jgi:hypothetical protein
VGGRVAARFGMVGQSDSVVPFTAVGFPRFKLRYDVQAAGSESGSLSRFRDSYHSHGTIAALSNWRQARLELLVAPPEQDPDRGHSPWEGMSGAVVWVDELIVGVVSEHHRRDGLNRLSATRVDAWYRMPHDRLDRLRELTGLPASSRRLPDVSEREMSPGTESDRSRQPHGPVVIQDNVVFDHVNITAETLAGRDIHLSDGQP